MRASRLILAAAVAAAVASTFAGCALKSPPARDEAVAQGMPNVRVLESWSTQSATAGVVADRWLASFNDPQLANAAMLPRISLTGAGNTISSDVFVLKERDNPVWSAGISLLAPLFLGGQLQSQVEIRTAEQKQALAEYGRIGARAFGEVENALSAEFTLGERETLLKQAVAENARALELADIRYRVGSGDLRAVQQQSLTLSAARTTLLRVQSERLVQRVNLHLAVGGSFETRPAPASGPQTSQ